MTTAIVFPGQGSQTLGMLADLAANFNIIKQTFTDASDILGFDLWDLSQNSSAALNQTQNTQVAMLTAGVAVYKVLVSEVDIKPSFLAGHSLGEWTALTIGGYLSFSNAVKIVSKRAELMQNATPEGSGAMAAVLGLSDEEIINTCDKVREGIVQAANFNAPGQVVISGEKQAVERALQLCKDSGAKRTVLLSVSIPSHCSLMDVASTQFANFISDIPFKMGNIAVVHNISATISNSVNEVKKAVIAQLNNSVLWTKTIKYLTNNGTSELLECGPGKVLTGLNKRINNKISSSAVFDTNSLTAIKNGR